MSISQNFPNLKPSLLLDFQNTKALDSRITFTRATTATYYDGKTVAKAEENLLTYSQEFDNAAWGKSSSSIDIVVNDSVAPDGTTTAEKFVQGTTTQTTLGRTLPFTAGKRYVVSTYLKYIDLQYFDLIYSESNGNYAGAEFDLVAETSSTFQSGADVAVSSSIVDVGNDWYRCVLVFDCGLTGDNLFFCQSDGVSARSGRGFRNFTGDGVSSVYIWGAQLEQRSAVTAYTPTTTQPITNYIPVLQSSASGEARFDHDPVTGESKGLLIEEQRTNGFLYSEDLTNAAWTKTNATITGNTIVAPDGTLTADKLAENTATGSHSIVQTYTQTATLTASVYAKSGGRSSFLFNGGNQSGVAATFDVSSGTVSNIGGSVTSTSIIPVGNGWYRCSMSWSNTSAVGLGIFLISGGSSSYTGDGYSDIYIWGAQIEAGAFPTSYIPTVASQVTRNADAASMTGTNFSSWYRADEGTLYAEAARFANTATFPSIIQVDDGTDSNKLTVEIRNTTGTVFGSSVFNGSTVVGLGSVAVGTSLAKLAFAYKVNDFAFSHNGTSALTDTSGNVPLVSEALIGGRRTSSQVINGHIKKLAYYPARLSNTELQGLTS